MTKRVLAAVVFSSAAVAWPLLGQADDDPSRRTLGGWRGVTVVVAEISDEAQRDGLREDQIRTDVELRLRLAGVTVITQQESLSEPGVPFVYVYIHTRKNTDGRYAYSARISAHQMVRLTRNPSVTSMGSTWATPPALGTVGADRLSSVRDHVLRDLTDQFINAYLAANPKRSLSH
jgi:hypothetical protein